VREKVIEIDHNLGKSSKVKRTFYDKMTQESIRTYEGRIIIGKKYKAFLFYARISSYEFVTAADEIKEVSNEIGSQI